MSSDKENIIVECLMDENKHKNIENDILIDYIIANVIKKSESMVSYECYNNSISNLIELIKIREKIFNTPIADFIERE